MIEALIPQSELIGNLLPDLGDLVGVALATAPWLGGALLVGTIGLLAVAVAVALFLWEARRVRAALAAWGVLRSAVELDAEALIRLAVPHWREPGPVAQECGRPGS